MASNTAWAMSGPGAGRDKAKVKYPGIRDEEINAILAPLMSSPMTKGNVDKLAATIEARLAQQRNKSLPFFGRPNALAGPQSNNPQPPAPKSRKGRSPNALASPSPPPVRNGSGPINKAGFGGSSLDMSEPARMQRARQQGFDVDTPLYHGTPDSRGVWTDGFKTPKEKFGEADPERVYFFAEDQKTASTYADDKRAWDYQNATAETIPVYLRMKNPATVEWSGRPFRGREKDGSGYAIRDYIDKRGTVDGKRLLDDFSGDPFGWSPDTTRYILAAMLMGGEIKLKVSGREVTAAGQQAIDALKTNNSFKPIGVALRDEKLVEARVLLEDATNSYVASPGVELTVL